MSCSKVVPTVASNFFFSRSVEYDRVFPSLMHHSSTVVRNGNIFFSGGRMSIESSHAQYSDKNENIFSGDGRVATNFFLSHARQ